MLDKWKLDVDKCISFGVPLTDLCKAFDCLLHGLLLSRFNVYLFIISALKLIIYCLQTKN